MSTFAADLVISGTAATLTVGEHAETPCAELVYTTDAWHPRLRNTLWLDPGYVWPGDPHPMPPVSICLFGRKSFAASNSGFASDTDDTFDTAEETLQYLDDDSQAYYWACSFTGLGLRSRVEIARARLELVLIDGPIADQARLRQQTTFPTTVADLDAHTGTLITPVSALGKVIFDVTGLITTALESLAAGETLDSIVLSLQFNPTGTSLDPRSVASHLHPTLSAPQLAILY